VARFGRAPKVLLPREERGEAGLRTAIEDIGVRRDPTPHVEPPRPRKGAGSGEPGGLLTTVDPPVPLLPSSPVPAAPPLEPPPPKHPSVVVSKLVKSQSRSFMFVGSRQREVIVIREYAHDLIPQRVTDGYLQRTRSLMHAVMGFYLDSKARDGAIGL
jgi:hypothetical protein